MMRKTTRCSWFLRRPALLMGLCVLVGCETGGSSGLHFGVRHLPRADRVSVFQAAREALSGMGFSVDRADPEAGVLTTFPARPERLEESARADLFGASGTTRRVATVRIETSPDQVSVYCKVEIQEPTTEAHRMRAAASEGSDLPTDTPIDRDAATTEEQNTVWQTVGRDREMERSLLDAITQASSGTALMGRE
ncbi:MAG: hypothetical protein IT449_11730 [Phycisphaerales bacterium]|nr:hypothetical protein [Phycisphaerales bacterium]